MSLIEYARERLSQQLAASGASPEAVEDARRLFDPNTLTLGFARRFASYKRPDLLLHDAERLLRLLTNSQRPMQLIMAGKAHPADQGGQALIQKWTDFIRRPEARPQGSKVVPGEVFLTQVHAVGFKGEVHVVVDDCGAAGSADARDDRA